MERGIQSLLQGGEEAGLIPVEAAAQESTETALQFSGRQKLTLLEQSIGNFIKMNTPGFTGMGI